MKKSLLFICILTCAMAMMAQGEHKKVLFIGNSYTEVNNLPLLVQQVAASVGETVDYESNTPGGCTFSQHCTNRSMELIQQGGWDIVVLQEQSQLPSFPQSQVEVESFPFASQLVEAVYRYNPAAEAMFYMTWGRENGDQANAVYFPVLETYEGMDSMLYERYMYMARTYDASVCPVGRVWRYLRFNHPEIGLYQADGSHPSMAGSYAAACAFYTLIFRSSPLEITYNPELSESDASIIREAVQRVVFDTLSFWLRQIEDTTQTDTTQIDTTNHDTTHVGIHHFDGSPKDINIYPNPTHDRLTIALPASHQFVEASLMDIKGRRLRRLALGEGETTFTLCDLPKGVYYINLVAPNDRVVARVVKQ